MNNKNVAELIDQLRSGDGNMRRRASTALGKIGDAEAVPAIVETLKDEYDGVRICAARALGEIGDASAIPALIEALDDWNYSVCKLSEGALRNWTLAILRNGRWGSHRPLG